MRYYKFFMLLIFIKLNAQINDTNLAKKNNFFLNFGIEHRLPPITGYDKTIDNTDGYIKRDDVLSGTAFNYSLNYFITEKLSFNFGQSFRSGIVFYKEVYSQGNNFEKAQKSFLIDYHFSLDYFIELNQKSELFFRFGYSFLNRGSEYSYTQNMNNNFVNVFNNQNYNAINTALGLKIKKLDFSIGIYFADKVNYTVNNDKINSLYFRINYNLFKL
jgi:hypothetical protein